MVFIMNQPDAAHSTEEFFLQRTVRANTQLGGITRSLNTAWVHNADVAPVAGDELPDQD